MSQDLGKFKTDDSYVRYENPADLESQMSSVGYSIEFLNQARDEYFSQKSIVESQAHPVLSQQHSRELTDQPDMQQLKSVMGMSLFELWRIEGIGQAVTLKKNTQQNFADKDESVVAYSKSEAKKIRKAYNKEITKGRTKEIDRKKLLASDGFMNDLMKEKVKDCENGVKTQEDLYLAVQAGKFQDYEKLDPLLKEELAVKYINDKLPLLLGNSNYDPVKIVDQLDSIGHEALAHPLFRLGISLGMRGIYKFEASGAQLGPEQFKELDDLINQRIMINTLVGPQNIEEQKKDIEAELNKADKTRGKKPQAVREAEVNDMIQRDKNARKYIMKSLLLTHIGNFSKNTTTEVYLELNKKTAKKTTSTPWTGSVATAFAHCSRVMFTMPSEHGFAGLKGQEKEKKLADLRAFREAYTGVKRGFDEKTGFFSRGAATHKADAAKKGKKAKEVKWSAGWLFDQSGINVAVGGIGSPGINKRILLNDGSCGHLYRYFKEGSDSEYGVMMLGFESDSYKKKNQLGHTHGFGNGESASSFGGQRVDEIGDKYGGRTVELTDEKLDLEKVTDMMKKIDEIVDNNPPDEANVDKVRVLAELLSGETMRKELDIIKFCSTLFGDGYNQYTSLFHKRSTAN